MPKFNFKTYKSNATRNAELAFDKMSKRVAPSPFFNDTDNIMFNEKEYKLYNFESTMYDLVINVCE